MKANKYMQFMDFTQDRWVFALKEEVLQCRLAAELGKFNNVVTQSKDFVYSAGELPVMLVAHTDTVHRDLPTRILYDPREQMLWSPYGIGGDDRAGIWGILALLRSGLRPYVLFCAQEERGGIGAKVAARELQSLLSDKLQFVIELDRRGHNDAVFYNCVNQGFIDYVLGFGYDLESGTYSDISSLCPEWGVAGVNLSTGYYNAHSTNEYVDIRALATTVKRAGGMLQNIPSQKFIYIPKAAPSWQHPRTNWGGLPSEHPRVIYTSEKGVGSANSTTIGFRPNKSFCWERDTRSLAEAAGVSDYDDYDPYDYYERYYGTDPDTGGDDVPLAPATNRAMVKKETDYSKYSVDDVTDTPGLAEAMASITLLEDLYFDAIELSIPVYLNPTDKAPIAHLPVEDIADICEHDFFWGTWVELLKQKDLRKHLTAMLRDAIAMTITDFSEIYEAELNDAATAMATRIVTEYHRNRKYAQEGDDVDALYIGSI